jgi:hypothetical protein
MKKGIVKICVFLAGLLVFQAFIGYMTLPQEVKNFRKYINSGIDCIYFCDSVMRFYTREDKSSAPIISLMKNSSLKFSVESIDHPAYNMDIYYSYCRAMLEGKKRPKAVIIPVSLYSLSAEWLRPGYKFELEQEALQSSGIFNLIFYRAVAALKRKTMTMEKYLNIPVYNGGVVAGKVGDFENISYKIYTDRHFRDKIISRYMYYADDGNEKLQSLKKITGLMKDSGVKMIFYIAPVDYEACAAAYGPEFLKNIDRNIAYISGVLKDNQGVFLDFSRLLKSDSFAWKDTFYVNEHLNYKGRAALARALTEKINGLFQEHRK